MHNGDYENLPDKGTPEGDAARYERYTAGGGDMEYDDWYCHSRGGRNGGEAHAAIQERLGNQEGFDTEVRFGNTWADAAGPGEIHQIGDLNVRGDPVARERDAINAILESEDYKGQDIYYWDKAKPAGPPIKNPQNLENWGARP